MEKTIEIDVGSILRLLRKNIQWLILGLVAGAVVFFVTANFFITPKYVSSVSLYVNNNSQSSSNTPININDINVSQKLVNTYVVILENDEVLQQVANKLMEEYSVSQLEKYIGLSKVDGKMVLKPSTLRGVLTMGSVNNTEVLEIKAETADAAFSARICNLMAEVAPAVLQRVVGAGSVEVIGVAKPAYGKSSPNIRNYTLFGALIGIVICAGIIIIRFLMDNTIKGEEDIRARFDVPVLGEIPDFETASKGRV